MNDAAWKWRKESFKLQNEQFSSFFNETVTAQILSVDDRA